jgi:hypothetical protein
MIRIAITHAAFDAIAATLSLAGTRCLNPMRGTISSQRCEGKHH